MDTYFSDTFSKIFDAYAAERLEKQKTESGYRSFFQQAALKCKKSPEEISASEWRMFFEFLLNKQENSKDTVIYKRRILRSVLSYIDEHKSEYGLTGSFLSRMTEIEQIDFQIYIKKENVASLSDANALIEFLERTHYDDLILLAASLALKYALSLKDIAALREENLFKTDRFHGLVIREENHFDRSIALAEDTVSLITKVVKQKPPGSPPGLFIGNRKNPIRQLRPRSLETRLAKAVSAAGLKGLTFLSLHNLSVSYLLATGVPPKEIEILTGSSTNWLFRYKPHVENLSMAGKESGIIYKKGESDV